MATDQWYLKELVADVPASELKAAMQDEDWEIDSDEDVDEAGESEGDYSDGEESDGGTTTGDETEGGEEDYSPHTPPGSPESCA